MAFLSRSRDASSDSESRQEDHDSLLSHGEKSQSIMSTRHQREGAFRSWIIIATAVFTCGMAGFLGTLLANWWMPNSDMSCALRTSQYSPVLKAVDIKYDVIRYNGSLFQENIFRQPAGPAVDAAWESLGVDYRSVRVPADIAQQSGLALDQVKIRQKYGGGYPANVEGLHHLHCLNLLRKALYYNFDYYHALGKGAFKNDDEVLHVHVTHCLDTIRQQLMCQVDTGVLGQVWVNPEAPFAYVDFFTEHKCKNFDAVRDWAEKHQLPENPPKDFLEPPKAGDHVYMSIP